MIRDRNATLPYATTCVWRRPVVLREVPVEVTSQEDAFWEVDSCPLPHQGVQNSFLSRIDDFVLAHRTTEAPPIIMSTLQERGGGQIQGEGRTNRAIPAREDQGSHLASRHRDAGSGRELFRRVLFH